MTTYIVLAAYLMGSVSSAILVCRLFGLADPRTGGSKNPGATNVLRLGGKLPAALTLLGDALKGVIPVLIGHAYGEPQYIGYIALAAFLGHLFPIFFRFQGGKGVATFIGALFALNWPLGLWFIGIWFMVAATTRYSSLAALVATLCLPFIAWYGQLHFLVTPLSIMAALILIRHRANIQRLIKGTESKIGQSA